MGSESIHQFSMNGLRRFGTAVLAHQNPGDAVDRRSVGPAESGPASGTVPRRISEHDPNGLKLIRLVHGCAERIGTLTERQRQVLRCVSTGATNSQIASRLGIAPATVENHVKDLKYRLGVDSRSLLAIIGFVDVLADETR